MWYWSLQHWTLFSPPVTTATEHCFHFGSTASFFLELLVIAPCFYMAQMVKNSPAMQDTWLWAQDPEDPLKKGMATYSSILAWEFHGQRNMVGYSPQVCKESDMTEWLTLPPVAYLTPSELDLIFWCHIFLPFHTVHGVLASIWEWLLLLPPVDHFLSELFIMTCPSWLALHSMAHNFI